MTILDCSKCNGKAHSYAADVSTDWLRCLKCGHEWDSKWDFKEKVWKRSEYK